MLQMKRNYDLLNLSTNILKFSPSFVMCVCVSGGGGYVSLGEVNQKRFQAVREGFGGKALGVHLEAERGNSVIS